MGIRRARRPVRADAARGAEHLIRAAVLVAAALALAACSGAPTPPTPPTAPATPQATAPATDPAEPTPDRPPSTVEPWPDHGDFAIDSNKAVIVAHDLAMDGNWDGHDHLQRIATMAQARWIGSWANDDRVAAGAEDAYAMAAVADRIGLIAYQGMRDYPCDRAVAEPDLANAYAARTEALVSGLPASGARVWFIIEPGLLADLGSCEGDPRGAWLSEAVGIIADAGGTVYLDAGIDGELVGATLAGPDASGLDLGRVAGFAIGTGAHLPDAEAAEQGALLLQTLAAAGVDVRAPRALDPGQPGLGFIIDSSRNGAPVADPEPCNPDGAALGKAPRLVDDGSALDAYVWIKRPGESDGRCNGGPDVGQFHVGLALAMARAADPSAA